MSYSAPNADLSCLSHLLAWLKIVYYAQAGAQVIRTIDDYFSWARS